MSKKHAFCLIISILIFDQLSKFYVKTHFELDHEWVVFRWFKILFVENDGMAWGAKISDIFSFISDKSAKLFLTLFRLVAVLGIGYWLFDSIKKHASKLLTCAIALIFSGALGNIIDSVFYGIIFNHSYVQKAVIFVEYNYSLLFYV